MVGVGVGGGAPVDVHVPSGDLLAIGVPDGGVVHNVHCKKRMKRKYLALCLQKLHDNSPFRRSTSTRENTQHIYHDNDTVIIQSAC